jgi:hypothetical protein
MPWNVKREGSVLDVRISVPVGSWGTLFDAVEQHLGHGLVGVVVPEHLPGAPPIDNALLQRFRDALTTSGVELLEPALV